MRPSSQLKDLDSSQMSTSGWKTLKRQEILLRAIRRVESEPSILGASPHLLAIARNR